MPNGPKQGGGRIKKKGPGVDIFDKPNWSATRPGRTRGP